MTRRGLFGLIAATLVGRTRYVDPSKYIVIYAPDGDLIYAPDGVTQPMRSRHELSAAS